MSNHMTSDQIGHVLALVWGPTWKHDDVSRAFVALGDLAVSMLRNIDKQREDGIPIQETYNENVLREAVARMADQKFPSGPPMKTRTR